MRVMRAEITMNLGLMYHWYDFVDVVWCNLLRGGHHRWVVLRPKYPWESAAPRTCRVCLLSEDWGGWPWLAMMSGQRQ